jgi:hypothetical protein
MNEVEIVQEVRKFGNKTTSDHLNIEDLDEIIRRITNQMENLQVTCIYN